MAQIELEAGGAGYFLLNDVPVQKGSVQVLQNGPNIGLQFIGTNVKIAAVVSYNNWGDGVGGVFGSPALLLTYMQGIIFQVST